jgi:ABC-type branched-subunit amino acid transport system ATPase component
MSVPQPLLDIRSVTVRFGGLVANNEIDLNVEAGEIAALIGPNGAGKTTLFNVITGAQVPTRGGVIFSGDDVTELDRCARARVGMGRTFQNLSLVPSMSVLDNATIGLGRFRRQGLLSAIFRLSGSQDRFIRETAMHALEFVGLGGLASRPTSDLPYGDRRRLELARALALAPRLLLLDEPSAGMGPSETSELADTIRRARIQLGVTVLLVEHDMSFVRRLADRTTVLEFGSVIASGDTESVLNDPRVADAYLGTSGTMSRA